MGYIIYGYKIDRDAWSKFYHIDMRHADLLVGTAERDNINLYFGEDNLIYEFPGIDLCTESPIVKTKKFTLLGKKIRRVALDYEGAANPVVTIIAFNRRFPDGVLTHNVTISEANRWYGIPLGYKCEYIQFMVTGFEICKHIRYTIT